MSGRPHQNSANRECLALTGRGARLGGLSQVLDPESVCQFSPLRRGEPQRRKETGFEPSDRMRRREQVVAKLCGVYRCPISIRDHHKTDCIDELPGWSFAPFGCPRPFTGRSKREPMVLLVAPPYRGFPQSRIARQNPYLRRARSPRAERLPGARTRNGRCLRTRPR